MNAGNPCVGLKAYVHSPVNSGADGVKQSVSLPDSLTPGESCRYLLSRWFCEPQTRSCTLWKIDQILVAVEFPTKIPRIYSLSPKYISNFSTSSMCQSTYLYILHKIFTSIIHQVMRKFYFGSSKSLVKRRRHQNGSRKIFKIYGAPRVADLSHFRFTMSGASIFVRPNATKLLK